MSIWPLCPNCRADAHEGARFKIAPEVFEEEHEPRMGEHMKSAAHLICISCTWVFPLWTYTVGDLASWFPNATGDDRKPWAPETPSWSHPDTSGLQISS